MSFVQRIRMVGRPDRTTQQQVDSLRQRLSNSFRLHRAEVAAMQLKLEQLEASVATLTQQLESKNMELAELQVKSSCVHAETNTDLQHHDQQTNTDYHRTDDTPTASVKPTAITAALLSTTDAPPRMATVQPTTSHISASSSSAYASNRPIQASCDGSEVLPWNWNCVIEGDIVFPTSHQHPETSHQCQGSSTFQSMKRSKDEEDEQPFPSAHIQHQEASCDGSEVLQGTPILPSTSSHSPSFHSPPSHSASRSHGDDYSGLEDVEEDTRQLQFSFVQSSGANPVHDVLSARPETSHQRLETSHQCPETSQQRPGSSTVHSNKRPRDEDDEQRCHSTNNTMVTSSALIQHQVVQASYDGSEVSQRPLILPTTSSHRSQGADDNLLEAAMDMALEPEAIPSATAATQTLSRIKKPTVCSTCSLILEGMSRQEATRHRNNCGRRDQKVTCPRCGQRELRRNNLSRHWLTKKCKQNAEEAEARVDDYKGSTSDDEGSDD